MSNSEESQECDEVLYDQTGRASLGRCQENGHHVYHRVSLVLADAKGNAVDGDFEWYKSK